MAAQMSAPPGDSTSGGMPIEASMAPVKNGATDQNFPVW